MKKKFFSLLSIGAMVAGFIACDEEMKYKIEIDNPKTTLTVGEKIEVKVSSDPAGLDMEKVNYEFSPEGVIDATRTDNGFQLVAQKKGTTTLTISCGNFNDDILFTVKAKSSNNGGSSDSGGSSGGSGSGSSDSDGGGGSGSGDDSGSGDGGSEDDGEGETPSEGEGDKGDGDGEETEEPKPEVKKSKIVFVAGDGGEFRTEGKDTIVFEGEVDSDFNQAVPVPKKSLSRHTWDKEIPTKFPAENDTITAIWHTAGMIIFDANDGIFKNGYDTMFFIGIANEQFPAELIPEEPTREGHVFNGWDENLYTLKYSENTSKTTFVYAKWTKLASITFKAGAGTFANGEREFVIYGVPNVDKIRPKFTGKLEITPDDDAYEVVGWQKEGTDQRVYFGASTKFTNEDVVLEAVYEKKSNPFADAQEGDVFVKTIELTNPTTGATSNIGIKVKKNNGKIVIFQTTKDFPPVENTIGWMLYTETQDERILTYSIEMQTFVQGYMLELGSSTALILDVVNNENESTLFYINLSINDPDWVKVE